MRLAPCCGCLIDELRHQGIKDFILFTVRAPQPARGSLCTFTLHVLLDDHPQFLDGTISHLNHQFLPEHIQ
jgi:hypothetical protein